MQLALMVYFLIAMVTFMALIFYNNGVRDYEELCTYVGAALLWFVTLPCSSMHWWTERQFRKKQQRKWEEQ